MSNAHALQQRELATMINQKLQARRVAKFRSQMSNGLTCLVFFREGVACTHLVQNQEDIPVTVACRDMGW